MRSQIPGNLYYEEGELVKVSLPQAGVLVGYNFREEEEEPDASDIEALRPFFTLPEKVIKGRFSIHKDGAYIGEAHILDANEDGTLNLIMMEDDVL